MKVAKKELSKKITGRKRKPAKPKGSKRKRQKTGEIKVEPSSIEPAAVAQNIHVSDTTIKTEPLDEITGLSSEQAKLFARKAVKALSQKF